jgi:hypothetical protein
MLFEVMLAIDNRLSFEVLFFLHRFGFDFPQE